jgi:hypothetical protein
MNSYKNNLNDVIKCCQSRHDTNVLNKTKMKTTGGSEQICAMRYSRYVNTTNPTPFQSINVDKCPKYNSLVFGLGTRTI